MKVVRVLALAAGSVLVVTSAAVATRPHAKKAKGLRPGEAFCPGYALIAPGEGGDGVGVENCSPGYGHKVDALVILSA